MKIIFNEESKRLELSYEDRLKLQQMLDLSERDLCKIINRSKCYLQYYRGKTQPSEVTYKLLGMFRWQR